MVWLLDGDVLFDDELLDVELLAISKKFEVELLEISKRRAPRRNLAEGQAFEAEKQRPN